MSEDWLEQIEQQVLSLPALNSPLQLRAAVLTNVNRELRASRWDRRLARAAALLMMAGLGLNVAIAWHGNNSQRAREPVVALNSSPSLVRAAIVVAEATDAATGKRVAQQLAAMSGRKLTVDEAAAIDAAIERPASHMGDGRRG